MVFSMSFLMKGTAPSRQYRIAVLVLSVSILGQVSVVKAANRIALVIGNADYSVGRLNNPVNDAQALAELLESYQFEVIYKSNLKDREAMELAVGEFTEKLTGKEVGLFYYSGHGIQREGENYLVPTQANIDKPLVVPYRAMNVKFLLDSMTAAKPELGVVILDACRDNPFPHETKGGANKGLARMDAPSDTIIAYAAKPGGYAKDGEGEHSPYAQHLLLQMQSQPNQPIDKVLNKVNVAVEDQTHGEQSPRLELTPLRREYCWTPCMNAPPPAPILTLPEVPIPPETQLTVQVSPEAATVRLLDMSTRYQPGMRLKPGKHLLEVTSPGYRRYLKEINMPSGELVLPVVLEAEVATRIEPEAKPAPVSPSVSRPVADTSGIDMVHIQPGCFQMGSPASEAERDNDEQQHQVCLTTAYAIGKTEVTQGQWRQVMGNNPSYFTNCGDACPVEQISWDDVQTFIQKLNAQTEGGYRLPTEAEWEYACRSGGQAQSYCGGNTPDALAWYDSNAGNKTHPVGSKAPNALGLYDMSGNVYEWVQDYYGDYPSSSVTDPHGPTGGAVRVFRGGSWRYDARYVRAAFRGIYSPDGRYSNLGFRLARTR